MPFLCCGSQAKVDADPAEVYFPPKKESDGLQQQKQCQDQIKQQITLTESKESEKPKGTKEQIQQKREPELVKQAPAPEGGQPREGPGQEQGPELSELKKPVQAEDQKRSQGDTICERQASAGHIAAEVGLLRETGQIEDAKAASGQSEEEAGNGETRIDMADSKGDSDLPSEHAEGRKEKTAENDAQAEHANTTIDKQESEGSSTPATYPSKEEALGRRELSAMEVNVHVAVTCVIMEGIEEHVCELELPPVDSNMFVAVTTPSIVSESVTSVVENTKNKEENILFGNEAKQLPETKTEQKGEPKVDSSGAEQSGRVGPSEEWTDSPCAKGPVNEAGLEAEEEVEENAARGLEERAPTKSPGAGSGEHPSGKHPVAPGDGDETEPVEERRRRRDRRQRRLLRSASGDDDTSDEDEIVPLRRKKVDGGVEKKWTRSSSLRRTFHHSSHNSGHQQDPSAHSDTEIGKISAPHSLLDGDCGSVGGSVSSERGIDVGRVGAWASSFEKLLEDPAGLHTFAEFLKKEYSHENIYFWTACERYKRLSNPDELRAMAKEIFERHLCIGASEPVNVDSQARQDAQDGLHSPNEFLFAQAQKQIFNLMKFDSYSRFLKSNLYKDCVSRDIRGQTLPYPGDETLDSDLRIVQEDSHVKIKKSKSDADERRRKSLLPWHRKDRSKSKDRGEAEYRRRKKMGQRNPSESSSVRSDMSGSRTSLNSSDIALGRRAVSKESLTSGELGSLSGSEGCNRCRVILPDLSNSVVAVRPGESIQVLLTRLLERRGISYSTFDVYQHKSDKSPAYKLMEKTEDSSVLGGLEVRLEQRILFRLDLPNRKTVCVKAKPNKLANEVLKPILHKYGYKLDLMTIHKVGEEKGVNLKCHVNELDGDRLVVQTKEEVKEWGVEPARQKKRGSLDEITNRVFEDLLNGKSEQNFDELGVLDFDARSSRTDRSSDRSSGILGGFSRRNSLAPDKESNKKPRKPNSRSSVHENLGVRGMMPPPEHAIVTKRRGNNPANAKQENDELYEGLKRAQRSRLDDQRGTEINFELPDFLKCDQPQDKENQHAHLADQLLAHLECSFSEGGVIPSHQEAEDYFSMAHPEVWGGIPSSSGPHSANATLLAPDIDLDDFDDTLQGDESLCQVPLPETTSSSLHIDAPDFSPPPPIPMENSTVSAVSRMPPPSLLLSPPPLPPKPKLGGTRGPPPRPPSRQLHLLNPPTFSSTSDDDALHSNDAPIHITRQSHDKFNISFV